MSVLTLSNAGQVVSATGDFSDETVQSKTAAAVLRLVLDAGIVLEQSGDLNPKLDHLRVSGDGFDVVVAVGGNQIIAQKVNKE
eukprot:ANDGO_01415.mRNA.1 hypothetical protein